MQRPGHISFVRNDCPRLARRVERKIVVFWRLTNQLCVQEG